MNTELSNDIHFESKGFMSPVNVTDFSIRDHKVILAHPINSGERKKKILSLHHGKFNVRVFGKLHAAIQYIISFYNSKSRK